MLTCCPTLVFSTLYTLLHTLLAFLTFRQPFADVLLLNGPASSVCLVATVVVSRVRSPCVRIAFPSSSLITSLLCPVDDLSRSSLACQVQR